MKTLFLIGALITMNSFISAIDFSLPNQIQVEYVDSIEKFQEIPSIQVDALEYLKSAEKASNVTRFIFVRHGQTLTNARGGLPGSRTSNDPLTETGIMQALDCGKHLVSTLMTFNELYLSPTLRTQQTMEQLQLSLGMTFAEAKDDRLHEKYHGRYEQYEALSETDQESLKHDNAIVKAKEIEENCGPSKSFLEKFPYSPDPEEIESLNSIYSRLTSFLNEKYEQSNAIGKERNILVVSHYGALKTLFMQDAYRNGFDLDYRAHDLKNCGIVVLEMNDEGMRVVATNGITFTPDKIKKNAHEK